MIGKIINTILTNDPTFSAAVGNDADGGIKLFPMNVPQNTALPSARYFVVGKSFDYTKDDFAAKVENPRVQLDIFSDSYSEAQTIFAAARSALDGYIGTIDGINVSRIYIVNENDVFEPEKDGEGIQIFRKSADFIIRVNT